MTRLGLILSVLLLWVGTAQAVTYWEETFEGNLYPNWTGGGGCITVGSPDGVACPYPRITTDLPHDGTRSLLSRYTSTTPGTNSGTFMDRSVTETNVLWTRQWVRWQNFTFGPQNGKLFITGGPEVAVGVYWLHQNAGNQLYPIINHPTTVTCPNGFAGDVCNYYPNNGAPISLNDNQWHCIETMQDNGTANTANGSVQLYIDDRLTVSYSGLRMKATARGYNLVRAYAQFGFGDRYQDQWAVGNTRIGGCGGSAPIDTTPPNIPTLTASVISGTSVSLTLSAGSDNFGVTTRTILRCSGAGCTPGTTLTTLVGTATSYMDTTVSPSIVYRYSARDGDAAGNRSALSTIQEVTPTAIFRSTTFTDAFTRADNTELGANWDAGYTARNPLRITSNQLRATVLGTTSIEAYNGTTPDDQWAQAAVRVLAGAVLSTQRVLVRAAAPPTFTAYSCTIIINGAPTGLFIEEITAGTPVVLATNTAITFAPGDSVRCEAQGTTIRMYKISGGVETLVNTTTDGTLTTGRTGLTSSVGGGGDLSNNQLDDFAMGGFVTATDTVTFDAVSNSADTNTTNSISWSHTTGSAGNRALVVCAYARDVTAADTAVTGITYAGQALTIVRNDLRDDGTYRYRTTAGYLVAPPSGTNTATITFAGTFTDANSGFGVGSAVSYGGVDPTAPLDAQAGSSGTGATASAIITTVANNAKIVDCVLTQDNTLAVVGAGQTQRANRIASPTNNIDGTAMSDVTKVTAGAETMDWTQAAANWTLSTISLKPGVATPVVAPTITSFVLSATGATLVHGPTTSTFIRIALEYNGLVVSSVEHPIATFTAPSNTIFTYTWPNGLSRVCMYARDALHVESPATASSCNSLTGIVGPLDTAPVVMSSPLPSASIPGTAVTAGFLIDKPAACRLDTVDRSYATMDVATTAKQMDVANLNASVALTGLANPATTQFYGRCNFVNSLDQEWPNLTSLSVPITTTTPADVTPPSTVTGLACAALGSTTAECTWTAATDNIAIRGYQVYESTGACSTYNLAGSPIPATQFQVTLVPNTVYCWKILALDTSNNASTAYSEVSTLTTPPTQDTERPSNMTNLRVISSGFTAAALLEWTPGIDNSGTVWSTLELSAAGCAAFTLQTVSNIALNTYFLNLSPSTSYCVRGFHSDTAGNRSLDYSNVVEFTTGTTGLAQPRPTIPFGVERPVTGTRTPAGTRTPRP